MVDAFELLQSQAAQTTNVFAAINQNTTRAYEAKRAALTAQMNTAINISQQAEQSRMNDMQLMQAQQEMQYKSLEMGMREKEFAANQKLVPLKLQYEESRMKAGLLENTIRQVDPFIQDLKMATSQTIFDHPELADVAERNLSSISTGIASDLLVNPEMNVQQEVFKRKQQYSNWLNQAKTKIIEEKKQPIVFGAQKNEIDLGKAKSIYVATGGDPVAFDKKHNKDYRAALDLSARHMKMTGKIDPATLALMDEPTRQDVIKSAEARIRIAELSEREESLRKSVQSAISAKNSDPEYIKLLQGELKEVYTDLKTQHQNLGIVKTGQGDQAGGQSAADELRADAAKRASLIANRPKDLTREDVRSNLNGLDRLKRLPIPEKVINYQREGEGFYPTNFDITDFKKEDIENLSLDATFMDAAMIAADEVRYFILKKYEGMLGMGASANRILTEELEAVPTPEEISLYRKGKMTTNEEQIFLNKLANITPNALTLIGNNK